MKRSSAKRIVRRALLLAAAAALLAGAPSGAQQASLTLVPEVAVWNEPVEVHLIGSGCSGAFAPPVEGVVGVTPVVDIDLLDCSPTSTTPFAAVARVGPLYPRPIPYKIRVRNATLAPTVLDEADLSVRDQNAAFFEMPEAATDAEPVSMTTWVQRTGPTLFLEPPVLRGNVIELEYSWGSVSGLPPPYSPGVEPIPWSLGPLEPGIYEVRLFYGTPGFPDTPFARRRLVVHDHERCVPSATALCLAGGRFRVEARWTDFAGRHGEAHPRPLDGDGASGLLWFFSPENIEVTAKVLDGCGVNGHYWVFLSSGSTVEFDITVTDTVTGASHHYANALGASAPLASDTSAFPCGGR